MDKAKRVKSQKTTQLGELVQIVGADSLPVEALAGALLAAVRRKAKKQPEAVARWRTECGQSFFQAGGKRSRKSGVGASNGAGEPAGGAASHGATTPAPGGGAA